MREGESLRFCPTFHRRHLAKGNRHRYGIQLTRLTPLNIFNTSNIFCPTDTTKLVELFVSANLLMEK